MNVAFDQRRQLYNDENFIYDFLSVFCYHFEYDFYCVKFNFLFFSSSSHPLSFFRSLSSVLILIAFVFPWLFCYHFRLILTFSFAILSLPVSLILLTPTPSTCPHPCYLSLRIITCSVFSLTLPPPTYKYFIHSSQYPPRINTAASVFFCRKRGV